MVLTTGKVLLAVDDEFFGMTMVDFLADHWWPEGTRFIVMHAIGATAAVVKWSGDQIDIEANRLVTRIADELRNALPEASVQEVVCFGPPKEAIVDLAAQTKAGLIVMGSHGRHGISKFVIGSVSQAVASHAPCSVAIVRAARTKTPAGSDRIPGRGTGASEQVLGTNQQAPVKVLVPVEDDEFGETIVDFLRYHGFPDRTRIRLLHVQQWIPSEREQLACPALIDFVEVQYADGRALVSRIASKLKEALPWAIIEAEITEGQPAMRIIDSANAWGANAIIMGSHGRTNFQQFFLGSIAASVLSHSECTVIIMRPAHDDPGLQHDESTTRDIAGTSSFTGCNS